MKFPTSKQANGLPPGLSEQQAETMMAEATDWHQGLGELAPTRCRFNVAVVTAPKRTPDGSVDEDVVRLLMYTPCGVTAVYLPVTTAEGLADALREHALVARTGLVIP